MVDSPWVLGKKVAMWTVLIFVAILLLGLATACGSATPAPSPSPVGPAPTVTVPFEMPVTIAITGRLDDQTLAILDEQIALFEAQNPDIKVAVFSAPRTESRRHDAYAALLGQGDISRDIYILDPSWLAEFDANDWLVPLDRAVELSEIALDDFLQPTVRGNTLDGQLVALPWLADGGLLYYRRDLLDEYGHQPPETWADLQRISEDIKAKEGWPYGFVWQGAANESLTCNTLEFVWAYGGSVLDDSGSPIFDSAETRAGLQQMTRLVSLGISPSEIATYTETSALAAFQDSDAVFMRNWAYAWDRLNSIDSPLAGQVGIAPLPASCLGGQSLALSAHSLHPEQASRFMAFLVDRPQQLHIARQGTQPPALETIYQDAELLAEEPIFHDLRTALSAARPRPQSPAYLEFSEIIFHQVNKMLLAEQESATTADTIQRQLESLLP